MRSRKPYEENSPPPLHPLEGGDTSRIVRLRVRSKPILNSLDYRFIGTMPHTGEISIGIASSPMDKEFVEFTVKKYPTGLVTSAIHNLEEVAQIGLRDPYGNGFPLKESQGKNIVIVSGGFAFTTLRSTIRYLLHSQNRSLYKNITVL